MSWSKPWAFQYHKVWVRDVCPEEACAPKSYSRSQDCGSFKAEKPQEEGKISSVPVFSVPLPLTRGQMFHQECTVYCCNTIHAATTRRCSRFRRGVIENKPHFPMRDPSISARCPPMFRPIGRRSICLYLLSGTCYDSRPSFASCDFDDCTRQGVRPFSSQYYRSVDDLMRCRSHPSPRSRRLRLAGKPKWKWTAAPRLPYPAVSITIFGCGVRWQTLKDRMSPFRRARASWVGRSSDCTLWLVHTGSTRSGCGQRCPQNRLCPGHA